LDHDGYLPDYGIITDGKQHDVKIAGKFHFSQDSITVFDRGYNDYKLFALICSSDAYFVTRLKSNADYTVLEERTVPQNAKGVLSDRLIKMNGFYAEKNCPYSLRVIEFYDAEHDSTFFFLTNNMKLSASTIAAIYKERWAIELFFKMLKQYLKIKTFVGTLVNAVKTQIWTALIAMLILKYLQLKSTYGRSLSTLSALLRMNIFTYRDLWTWINSPFLIEPEPDIIVEQTALNLV
jgi:IS4 transposase